MSNSYKDKYNKFYQMIMNLIKESRINHAYLIQTDEDKLAFAIDLAQTFLASRLDNETEKEQVKLLIECGNYNDLKIVKADGQWIKKEQILELQKNFSSTSFNNNYQIYIIEEAEKLNKSSANTLLKFLEEPAPNIIAILMTGNINMVLETIKSRCQIYKLSRPESLAKEKIINPDAEELVKIFENKKEKTIAYLPENLRNIDDRKKLQEILECAMNLYDNVLQEKLGLRKEETILITELPEKLTIEEIANRIDGLNTVIELLKYNTNLKLLMDKLIILMNGVEKNV